MRERLAATTVATLVLVLAAFTATSLAGNGHGNGGGNGNGNGNGNQGRPAQPAPPAPPQPVPAPQQSAPQPASHGHGHGNSSKQSDTSPSDPATGGSNANGVKPSSTTKHDTYAKASSDKTKKYGNGKTAGQIATQVGYGDATLHGPGNSQPHKTMCGGHEVDVHALKHKGSKCGESTASTPAPRSLEPARTHEEHTPSTPSKPAKPVPAPSQPATPEPCAATTQTVTEQVLVGVKHFIGPKGSGRYVVIHPSAHSAHYTGKHPDDQPIYETVTHSIAVPAAATCEGSSTQAAAASTQTQHVVAATHTSATAAGAVAAAPAAKPKPTSVGAVKGATAPLTPAATHAARGGVLGTTTRLGSAVKSGHLPFTGLPLWVFVAVAAALILAGAVLRRSSADEA